MFSACVLRPGTRFRVDGDDGPGPFQTLSDELEVRCLHYDDATTRLYQRQDGARLLVLLGDDPSDRPFRVASSLTPDEEARVVEVGPVRLLPLSQATREAYARPCGPGLDGIPCGPCGYCRNFRAVGAAVYPPAVMSLFERLGVDAAKETELGATASACSGVYYWAWLRAAGLLVLDAPYVFPEDNLWATMGDGVELRVLANERLPSSDTPVHRAFTGLPTVDIEVRLDGVPWVLEEAPPLRRVGQPHRPLRGLPFPPDAVAPARGEACVPARSSPASLCTVSPGTPRTLRAAATSSSTERR